MRFRWIAFAFLLTVYTFFAAPYLVRDLWFDEALTFLNFTLLPSVSDIYFNYVIPNNQIVYTLLLRFWTFSAFLNLDVWMRLFSFLLGGATLALLYFRFKTRMGGRRIFLVPLTALACAVPFLVYATALRGYILSAFLTVFTLDRALEFARRGTFKTGFFYALGCFLLTGTIPTNLLCEAAVLLYILPLSGEQFYRKRRFWIAAAIPALMFALFYLPILRQFIGVLQLGEGWQSGGRVLAALLAAVVFSFAILLIPAATGSLLAFSRPRFNRLLAARAAIWFLPIPAALLLPTAPFPRVFIPLFPVFMLLLAGGLRDLAALQCRKLRHRNFRVWSGALLLLTLAWGMTTQNESLRLAFSRRNGGAGADDFFYSYYLRPAHTPRQTIQELQKRSIPDPPEIYMSFSADPWALMYYGALQSMEVQRYFHFDGPRGKVKKLAPGTFFILRADEDTAPLEKRFNRPLKPVFRSSSHAVYQ